MCISTIKIITNVIQQANKKKSRVWGENGKYTLTHIHTHVWRVAHPQRKPQQQEHNVGAQ